MLVYNQLLLFFLASSLSAALGQEGRTSDLLTVTKCNNVRN